MGTRRKNASGNLLRKLRGKKELQKGTSCKLGGRVFEIGEWASADETEPYWQMNTEN